ncbi:hypothetical protein [Actinoplanes regularis]|uniref:Uncharacterized protein n=1 Tax=Actinoplanes regularis TaxID=52697 RepID=A0A239CI63_9ACTN|nr:hypothetical protein [Actinoplanes regularis]SNS19916.1 hypothetical protein SAMN06264365_111206 [Actinoplanes regularis]
MVQLVVISAAWVLLIVPCAWVLLRRPTLRRPASPGHLPRRRSTLRRVPAPGRLPRKGSAQASWARRPGPQSRELRRLDRELPGVDLTARAEALPVVPIEQLAYDLRRLDRQRRSGPLRSSEVCMAALLQAYDVRLQLACRCLGLTEDLQPLRGVDREIERFRVECQLEAAGLALRD